MAKSKNPKAAGLAGASGSASVAVRMYRIGLGDCFLLTFQEGERCSRVLIDCGTLGASNPERSVSTVTVGACSSAPRLTTIACSPDSRRTKQPGG